ncbi:MAG: hypothetical protein AB7O73_02035, partial [Bacteroidia bacterium]
LFKKDIVKFVIVKIVYSDGFCSINQTAAYPKYVMPEDVAKLEAKFLDGLNSEGKLTKNVTIDNNSSSPDFIITVKSLKVEEGEFEQTVNDSKSSLNGQKFYLNKVQCTGVVEVIDGKTNKQIGLSCSNTKSRQEKLKNNRDLGDLITGANKDHSVYREKTLRSDIASDLSGDVGRRIWVPITKRIRKNLK